MKTIAACELRFPHIKLKMNVNMKNKNKTKGTMYEVLICGKMNIDLE